MRILSILIVFFSFHCISQDTLKKSVGTPSVSTASVKNKETEQNYNQLIQSLTFKLDLYNKNLTRRSMSEEEVNQIAYSLQEIKKRKKNSFEYNYFKYLSGAYDVTFFPYLKKAEKLKPNSPKVIEQMVGYYLIIGDTINAQIYLDTIFTREIISKSLVDYGNDLLKSVPQNGVIITHGKEDTYALEYIQINKGVRKDVDIVSLELLQSSAYRTRLEEKGFVLPKTNFIDTAFYVEFLRLNETKNIATSLTVPKQYLKNVTGNLFLTGLVMQYSKTKMGNFNLNYNLWRNEFDYSILNNTNDAKSKELSSNYLPMLLQIRSVYKQTENNEEIIELNELIDRIAVFCGKEEIVQRLKERY